MEKTTASTRNQLEQMLKIVEEFSDGMQFGLDKSILNMVKGRIQPGGLIWKTAKILQKCAMVSYTNTKE